MDKIIALCELFDCTMDELVKGKVSVDKSNDRKIYDRHFDRYSKGIAIGVALIIFGIAATAALSLIGELIGLKHFIDIIPPIVFFMFLATAVTIFIILGLEHSSFLRTHHQFPELYSAEELEEFHTRTFPKLIALGVILIFVALISIIASEGLAYLSDSSSNLSHLDVSEFGAALFLGILSAGVGILTYAGIQHSKYNIDAYNREGAREAAKEAIQESDAPEMIQRKKRNSLSNRICAIIMLVATGIFLAIGFLTNVWHPTWAVFPLGGILCAIVNVAIRGSW